MGLRDPVSSVSSGLKGGEVSRGSRTQAWGSRLAAGARVTELGIVLRRGLDLGLLLLGLSTLLFLLLRATGDPISALASDDATPEMLAALRTQYGFDESLPIQYAKFLGRLLQGDFGQSMASGDSALSMVLQALPATLLLAFLAMGATIMVAVPLGAWLGSAPDRPAQRAAAAVVYVLQGTPGFVAALVLVQVFAIQTNWLPALGFAGPRTWVLPALSLSLFLAPKLARVVAVNVDEMMRQDFVRAARAAGAGPGVVLWRHVLPNAMLGAVALMGAQFAALVGGAVVIETIFAWPGLGRLLVQSTLALDFPVIQAAALVVAGLVFAANVITDLVFVMLDPRLNITEAR
ncbi:ABC transporter permease [Brevundimonas sp. UBA2416]|jgi:peptide/nickel transport system permease protein|uniref:ABC transporter permease n=1 Tax=Brevundimonas sp. UBA2416 TaxID=1946124 RepID=UPI0025BE0D94|nr:ABC transporter permease [Brevundimonas sp. UBA2416]